MVEPQAVSFHPQLIDLAHGVFADAATDRPDDEAAAWCAVIVLSGLACDAAAAHALRRFSDLDARRRSPKLGPGQTRRLHELLRSKKAITLKPKAQRAYWEALSSDRLARWTDWIRYIRCVERRNAVLHEGVLPSRRLPGRADAVEAIEVMHSLDRHLREVIGDAASEA